MGNHHDSIALDWVRGEIQDTLTQGQHALEAYVENRDDTARLRFCLNYLHQVHGTLQMVELYGAALLTEEMEKLTQAILDKTVSNVDEAVDVLMEAILQLPQYLEHLASSQDDFPMLLLPLLNDLRAARGDSLLSDTSLFKPDLSRSRIQVSDKASRRLTDPKVLGHVRKLRQMYQYALARIVREEDLETHFDYMQKVLVRLIRLCKKTPRGELWKAASAFVETLQANANPINAAVKSLLRELDNEIRLLAEESATILQQPAPEALLKHLLYYVARARDLDSPQVTAMRSDYLLDQALPSEDDVDEARNRVSGPGRETIHSVVSALNEELAKLKDQLDLFVRAEFRQNAELEDLLPGMHQVANTLAVLGLGIPRKVITDQIELINRLMGQAETVDDGILMDIAGALLYVEASLAGFASNGPAEASGDSTGSEQSGPGVRELSEANSALLRESRSTLEQVKSAIVNFIASQWDTREIEHVPELLHSIRGGLGLIPLERVAEMLGSAEQYISNVLLDNRHVPDWKQLDTLADAVTSIEYYLERLSDGIDDNDSILRVAEDSLVSLGFPVGAEPTWSGSDKPAEVSEEEPEQASSAGSTEELVDDEILGIFVEEAEEVLDTIREFYPRLRQSPDDHEALTEVRRAFHTLKGSGRLVGASSLGELAWAVENLLNRVIDQTIKPGDELFTLVDEVNDRLPSLISEFREGNTTGDVEALIQRAEAMATTRRTDTGVTSTGETSPEPAAEVVDEPEEAPSLPVPEAESTVDDTDDDLIDDEILEIFVEEAGEVLETIGEYLPALLSRHDDHGALTEIRRAFHTLKGSGRMVGAMVIGELAWSVENMLNRVIDGSIFMNDDVGRLLADVTEVLPGLVADFEHHRAPGVDTAPLEARANALSNGEIPSATPVSASTSPQDVQTDDDNDVDPVLTDIFVSEAQLHLQTLKDYLSAAGDKASVTYTDDLTRALHTLKGSAHTAGIAPIATVITPLERFIKESRSQNLRADQEVLGLIREACDFLDQGLAQIQTSPQAELPGTQDFLERLGLIAETALRSHSDQGTDEPEHQESSPLVRLFLNEGLDIVLDADRILDQWSDNPWATDTLDRLRDEIRQLSKGATEAGLTDIAVLTEALTEVYDCAEARQQSPDDAFFTTVRAAHEHLITMMDQVAAGLATDANEDILDGLKELVTIPEPSSADSDFAQGISGDLEEIDQELDIDESGPATTQDTDESELPPLPGISESDEDTDQELADIFMEEARDLVDSTAEALHSWSESTHNLDILRLLQRDLHTLKGGARLAGIAAIGDLSHELETLFEGLTEQRLNIDDRLSDLLFRCHDRLAGMVEALEAGEPPRPASDLISDVRAYIDTADQDRQVTDVHPEAAADQNSEPAPETAAEEPATDLSHLDPELTGIFLEEAYDLINSTGSSLHSWSEDPSNREIAAELQRDIHTLKGGARMAGVSPIGDLTHVLEDLFEKVADGRLDASDSMTDLLFACHDRLAQMVEQVATQKACPAADDLIARVKGILKGNSAPAEAETALPEPEVSEQDIQDEPEAVDLPEAEVFQEAPGEEADDDDLIALFLDECLEIHDAIGECLAQWQEEPEELAGVTLLQQELHTLKGGARLADIDPIADLAEAWSGALDRLISGSAGQQDLLTLSSQGLSSLKQMLTRLQEGSKPDADTDLLAAFENARKLDTTDTGTGVSDDNQEEQVDPEVVEIFLEEAGEIIDQLEQLFDDWRKEPGNGSFCQQAQRALHTLKGGARLSQLSRLGDMAHAFESRLVSLEGQAPDETQWQAISEDYDAIIRMVSEIREQSESTPADTAPEETDQNVREETPATSETGEPEAKTPAEVPARVTAAPAKPAGKPARSRAKAREIQKGSQETIRVSSPLLEELVNLAGETSITRGRLEQQTSDFSHTLEEMAATIERLREQLRRMEIETEAQILFSAEKEHGPDYGDDFDPLEMDRYSSIQQLSRALTESSSDLADLRETLSDRVRDTETLLVQQSRINTELQEGLMKTRMVPFASMMPRLRRIVRQISSELGKKVNFDVRNAEGEMDRNILERMVAPLEHMLRNAVDHGIEKPEQRQAAGKPEAGEVTLSLSREGGDVVLRMQDDGAGIPSPVIRDKAIRQGLMRPDDDLSEREILQFILQPGFSTAQQVTQISGRGVGMDVVASEIKQLGGSLDIDSRVGQGTTFTVRLPFTVSVNRALMVATGDDFYAIPLNTIEGIVRVSTYELEEYYKPDAPLYEYAGQQYRLQYLGSLLNSERQPKLQGQVLPLPVILVRGAEQPIALQVDNLMGSREIVVKSLGPQFGSVRGVSGATILGDGNVVVILDLPAMIRHDILSEQQRMANQAKAEEAARFEDQITTVMVVDDSVTVRKVTSRLLERNGMEVITAKDGLDAVAQLQDHKPDVILLDIEMPRMDGFEVASFVRHDDSLRDTPICMITSRTGEKHRERAMAIGVNEYLGKPFQETELLATIERLTGNR